MLRALAYASACALILSTPAAAAPDSIAISTGGGGLYWDGSLTSLTVASADSQFTTETHTGARAGFAGGTTVDLSTTIPFSNSGFHPLGQTYHGQQYQAWVSGSMTITARPFVAPHPSAAADGTFQSFTTTFTMTGTVTGWATSDHTGTPLFTTSLTGGGTISSGSYRVVGDSYLQQGAEVYEFTSPTSPVCSSWRTTDVGAVGMAGFSSTCGDTRIMVIGSGADIWGTADAFQWLYQPIAGDGQLVVQLTAPVKFSCCGSVNTQAGTYAKAGIMLRQTLDPSSPEVILDVRPGGGIEFMQRATPGGMTAFIAGGATAFPVWLRLDRSGSLVSAFTSTDGASWTPIGSTTAPTGDAMIGMAVTSHDNSTRDEADFAKLSLSRLPAGWSQQDVGAVGRAGTATATDGVFTVAGAGDDIWGTNDAFHAVTQPLSGDSTLVARVVDEQSTHMFAKAGVTIGQRTPSAARVILDVRPDGNIEFMARMADGGAMSFLGGTQVTFPVWLRLTRSGDRFTGSVSANGTSWTDVGSVTATLPSIVPGGLAVTSHDPTMLNTATFDQVSVATNQVTGTTGGSQTPSANLLQNPGFESSAAPALGPGWISDAQRQSPARSETVEPHSGSLNGACRTTTSLDCGIYQDVTAPADGTYTFTASANASRAGAWIGVNVNGIGVQSTPVTVGAAGAYGPAYSFTFPAKAGDMIRVWLYSPATPGSAVIDDARLTY